MNKTTTTTWAIGKVLLLVAMLSAVACSDMDEYFETPDWIEGSIYEKLEADGQYSQFIKGADRAGFKPILDGKSILTVMAPTDQAMATYLQQAYGKSDISELSDSEVKKLIGFHILYYAFDKDMLINFRPDEGDGATAEQKLQNAGLYFKFRTKSQDPVTQENDTAFVYHLERYVPVFSHLMFRTKGIEAQPNYEYFFRETGWNGADGFQVANANVTDYNNIAKNGYIYKVDRVLRPLETIYTEMRQAGKYEKFLSFYDTFKTYQKDDDLTLNYGNGLDLYQVLFEDRAARISLPPIASEWPVTNYRDVTNLAYKAYSIFAPTDQALQDFFNDYWREGGYEVLDSVSPTLVSTMLRHCIYEQSFVFPEEVERGLILDSEKQPIKFNTSEVPQADRIVCSNGVLYGCSVLTPPAMFNSVTGPAYQYKKYSTFQQMLASSGMQSTLCQDAVSYIMLYPDNDQLRNNAGIEVNAEGKLVSTAQPNGMSAGNVTPYIYAHVASPADGNSVLPTTGKKVLQTLSPDAKKTYWYVKDGRITHCIKHNERLHYAANPTPEEDIFVPFQPLDYRGNVDGWSNGHAYAYEKLFFEGNFSNINDSRLIRLMYAQRADETSEFFGWVNLLDKAGVINHSSQRLATDFTADECLMFIPVTQAVEQAIVDGRIPGITANDAEVGSPEFFTNTEVTDAEALQEYLKLYFVPLLTAVITNYPYVGWGEDTAAQGGLITLQQRERIVDGEVVGVSSTNMNIYDDGTRLSIGIIGNGGAVSRRVNVTDTYDYFPFIFDDVVAHFIEDVL